MVSVIIPTYNDVDVLPRIVEVVKQSNIVDEIIIVNDGSTIENTKKIHKVKGVKIIDQPTNMGKSMALKTGFLESKGDIVSFLDADLSGLRSEDIFHLINPVVIHAYEMTLSKRGGFTIEVMWRLIGTGESLTGERAFQRKIIEENLEIFDSEGFNIEVVMNKIFFKKYKIALVIFPFVQNKLKIKKLGVKEGVKSDIKMMKGIVTSVGFKEFILQGLYVKNFDVVEADGNTKQSKYNVVDISKIRKQLMSEINKLKSKI
jgi:polyisoprenyl-phosphate glycosyltransferase